MDKLKLVKLHLSAIFNRKMKWLIVLDEKSLLFTNIPQIEIMRYPNSSAPETAIHKVVIKDTELWEALCYYIPILRLKHVCIDLKKLLQFINKLTKIKYDIPDDLNNVSWYKDYTKISALYITKDNVSFIGNLITGKLSPTPIATLIDEVIVLNYLKAYRSYTNPILHLNITLDLLEKDGNMYWFKHRNLTVPIAPGSSGVSLSEYDKKIGTDSSTTMEFCMSGKMGRFLTRYKNKYIEVETIQPKLMFLWKT